MVASTQRLSLMWFLLTPLMLLATVAAPALVHAAGDRHVVLVSIDGLSASYLSDPKAELPTLRMLAQKGAMAKGLVSTFPSVTWPAHVSLITGASPRRHGVISNSVIDRRNFDTVVYIGDPFFTKDECVQVPTLYDAVHEAKMKTAAVIWPASNGAKSLDWMIPDSNQQRLLDQYTTPGLREELGKANISIERLGTWGWDHRFSAMRDATYTKVAKYLLAQRKPHLLLLHLITPDGFEHDYGPNTEEAYWACETADRRIRELWDAIQASPLREKTTLVVVSDHGFAEYTQVIQLNALFRRLKLLEVDENNQVTKREAFAHSNGGSAGIYLAGDAQKRAKLAAELVPLIKEQRGIDAVVEAKDFVSLGQPLPSENPLQADLLVSAKPGYAFSNLYNTEDLLVPVQGKRGAHGHLPDQPYMHGIFVAAGAGVKSGARLDKASCLDVAPTIAQLLGVSLPTAEGRVLKEILE